MLARPITSWEQVPIVFDIPLAARILGMSVEHTRRMCKRGELPAFRCGKMWRFKKEDFLEYIRDNSVTPFSKKE